jgi:predicted NBD/HSP70 family sugar kinase
MLGRRLGLTAVIENDANLVTLAERWFGQGQNIENFVVVTVEAGIGMGLFINGDLYRGHHGLGTEFGHVKIDRQGPLCRCGQNGCIEAFVGDYAILREARKLTDLPESEDDAASALAFRQVAERARAGDAGLLKLFDTAGEILGLGIANLINIIDPGKVIITGSSMCAADLLEPSLRPAVTANSLKVLRGRCEIVLHDWSDEIWARGAASLVLQGLYRIPWSRTARIEMAL